MSHKGRSTLLLRLLLAFAVVVSAATRPSQLAHGRNEGSLERSSAEIALEQDDGRPEGLRKLMQEATPETTYVANNLQELSLAMIGALADVRHIELRAHVVLTNLTGPDPQGADGPYDGGPFAPNVKSIRGNCTGPIDEALNDVLAGAPLLPLSKGQCLLVNNGNMTSSFGDWWADNIYMRYASQGDPTPGGGNVVVKEGQNLWYTRVTFQWSGGGGGNCADCVNWTRGGMEVLGALYTEKSTFAHLRADSVIHTAETGSSTILETLFMENVVQDAVLTGDSGGTGTGATVSVERSLFRFNEAPALLAAKNWTESSSPVFYVDSEMEVATGDTDEEEFEPSSPLEDLPESVENPGELGTFLERLEEAPPVDAGSTVEFPGTSFVINEIVAFGTQVIDDTNPSGSTGSTASSPSSSNFQTSESPSSESEGLSSGAITGISIAVALLALLFLGCAVYVFIMRSRKKKLEAEGAKNEAKGGQNATKADTELLRAKSPTQLQRSLEASLSNDEYHTGRESIWSEERTNSTVPSSAITRSTISDATWLAEDVSVSRNGPRGGLRFAHHTRRTALTTMGSTASLGGVHERSAPLEKLLAQLEWISIHRGGKLFATVKLAMHQGKRVGGQGVVIFAQHVRARSKKLAVKFYLSKSAFDVEMAAALNPDLRAAMPPVSLIQNDDAALAAAVEGLPEPLCQWPLPKAIVMEKGESLEEFSQRSAPDFFTSLQVMMHIAQKLKGLHEAGWVHGDLKPGNAIWLPSSNSWTLIDFGSAARVGEPLNVTFTVKYAAPEVIKYFKASDQSATVHPAADVWSFGIICYELLTQQRYYCPFAKADAVIDLLASNRPLPSEQDQPEVTARLGTGAFRDSVLSMLSRDPTARPTLSDLIDTWNRLYPQPGVAPPLPLPTPQTTPPASKGHVSMSSEDPGRASSDGGEGSGVGGAVLASGSGGSGGDSASYATAQEHVLPTANAEPPAATNLATAAAEVGISSAGEPAGTLGASQSSIQSTAPTAAPSAGMAGDTLNGAQSSIQSTTQAVAAGSPAMAAATLDGARSSIQPTTTQAAGPSPSVAAVATPEAASVPDSALDSPTLAAVPSFSAVDPPVSDAAGATPNNQSSTLPGIGAVPSALGLVESPLEVVASVDNVVISDSRVSGGPVDTYSEPSTQHSTSYHTA